MQRDRQRSSTYKDNHEPMILYTCFDYEHWCEGTSDQPITFLLPGTLTTSWEPSEEDRRCPSCGGLCEEGEQLIEQLGNLCVPSSAGGGGGSIDMSTMKKINHAKRPLASVYKNKIKDAKMSANAEQSLSLIRSVHEPQVSTGNFSIVSDPESFGGAMRVGMEDPYLITRHLLRLDGRLPLYHQRLILAHELGHSCDEEFTQDNPHKSLWKNTVKKTDTYLELMQAAAEDRNCPMCQDEDFAGWLEIPLGAKGRGAKAYSSWSEIFARNYSQWIATKTQDAGMLRAMREQGDIGRKYGVPQMWGTDEFQEISPIFDLLFRDQMTKDIRRA